MKRITIVFLTVIALSNISFSQKKVIDVIKNHGWYNKTWSTGSSEYYTSFTKTAETQMSTVIKSYEEFTWKIKILKDNGKTLEYVRMMDEKSTDGLTYLIVLYNKNNFRRFVMRGEKINTTEDFQR